MQLGSSIHRVVIESLLICGGANTQAPTGTLEGNIRDVSAGVASEVQTGTEGYFVAPFLLSGPSNLLAIDVALHLGKVATTIDGKRIVYMPLNGRNSGGNRSVFFADCQRQRDPAARIDPIAWALHGDRDIRLDHSWSDKLRMFGGYSHSYSSTTPVSSFDNLKTPTGDGPNVSTNYIAPALSFGNAAALSLFENFTLRGRMRAQFRAEPFNATNTTLFNGLATNLNNSNARPINSALSPGQVQLAFKIVFQQAGNAAIRPCIFALRDEPLSGRSADCPVCQATEVQLD